MLRSPFVDGVDQALDFFFVLVSIAPPAVVALLHNCQDSGLVTLLETEVLDSIALHDDLNVLAAMARASDDTDSLITITPH